MTEGDLKQEIEEYLDRDYCCEFKGECKDGVRVRCSEYEAKLYLILRFAEPREKRIEELEKNLKLWTDTKDARETIFFQQKRKIAELKADNDARRFAMIMSEKVEKQLREENAKLKKELKDANEKVVHLACNQNKDLKYKLTKAKEIILKLYNAGRDVLMCRAEEKAYDNLDNAINDRSIEQFLKDIEKC